MGQALTEILELLRSRRDDLRRLGVVHVAVFGSLARGDDRPDSDVYLVVDVDPAQVPTLFDMGGIQQSLEDWVGRSVDVARRDRLRPGIAVEAARDAIDAFR